MSSLAVTNNGADAGSNGQVEVAPELPENPLAQSDPSHIAGGLSAIEEEVLHAEGMLNHSLFFCSLVTNFT